MTALINDTSSLPVSPLLTITVDEDGIHDCNRLRLSNRGRVILGEPTVSVLKSGGWYFRVGLEFAPIKYCPFCGEEL